MVGINSDSSESENLLYRNSCNISAMIHLLTIHENNVSRFLRQQNTNENSIVNLLNNVITMTHTDDISGGSSVTRPSPDTSIDLVLADNSINKTYLNEIKYEDVSNKIYNTCPISRETFTDNCTVIQIKKCKHYFRKASMLPWLRQSSVCPYCRVIITSNENNMSFNPNVDTENDD